MGEAFFCDDYCVLGGYVMLLWIEVLWGVFGLGEGEEGVFACHSDFDAAF